MIHRDKYFKQLPKMVPCLLVKKHLEDAIQTRGLYDKTFYGSIFLWY